jgi:TetR/AcrR family transcriptional regulator, ethionamide resistance regulator
VSTRANASARGSRVPKDEARRRIRDAATRLLRERDYRDLSVDAVMAEAGLARTVFYRHFDGLPALVLSLLEEFHASLMESGDPADPEYLRRVLVRAVDVARRNGPLLRAIDDAARHDPDVERAYREFVSWSIDTTAAIYAEGVASGRVREAPDLRATSQALTLMNGAFLSDTLGRADGDVSPELAVEVLWTIWARVLGLD